MTLVLYDYWRSGAAYRVRIGLNLKGLTYEPRAVNLIAGDQAGAAYGAVNPQHLVPSLETPEGVLTQSLAILEWLEETRPDPPLLPRAALDRAIVRAMADIVACDVHPLNNVRVGRRLMTEMGHSQDDYLAWMRHWMREGFDALEPLVARHGGGFAFGDSPTLADCCLVPQVYSARRYDLDLAAWPAIAGVAERAAQHPAFQAAHPDRQPDAKAP